MTPQYGNQEAPTQALVISHPSVKAKSPVAAVFKHNEDKYPQTSFFSASFVLDMTPGTADTILKPGHRQGEEGGYGKNTLGEISKELN